MHVAHAGDNFCRTDEAEIFSCGLQNEKKASLCKSVGATNESLTYRYGKFPLVEMEFSGQISKNGPFFYSELQQRLSSYFELGFTNGDYRYRLVREWDENDERPTYHLFVGSLKKESKNLHLRCVRDIVDKGLRDQTGVSCDPGMIVGCSYIDRKDAGYAM